jgi:hypothetical protein
MMLICGQSNRIWHYWAGRHPGSVGVLVGPSYRDRVPIDPWMPFALDNDAFMAWRNKKEWDVGAWREMLRYVRLTRQIPLWAAVPDAVADRHTTLAKWKAHADEIQDLGWPAAFCVQDGMTPSDVPKGADVVFVGGTDGWKFPNLKLWTDNFPRVHCARVNAPAMFEACERLGCESVDGTGWFREPSRDDKVPALKRFIEGHRRANHQHEMQFT